MKQYNFINSGLPWSSYFFPFLDQGSARRTDFIMIPVFGGILPSLYIAIAWLYRGPNICCRERSLTLVAIKETLWEVDSEVSCEPHLSSDRVFSNKPENLVQQKRKKRYTTLEKQNIQTCEIRHRLIIVVLIMNQNSPPSTIPDAERFASITKGHSSPSLLYYGTSTGNPP